MSERPDRQWGIQCLLTRHTQKNLCHYELYRKAGTAVLAKTIKEVLELTTDDMKQMLKFFP